MLVILTSCANDPGEQGVQSARLKPCSAEGSIFAKTTFTDWKKTYHGSVSKAVGAHMKQASAFASLPIKCTEDDYANLLPASAELKTIARMVPQWSAGGAADKLTETDMGTVLLEFLRVYECSMNERKASLPIYIQRAGGAALEHGELNKKQSEEVRTMDEELTIARASLERTLALVGGYDRLRPLALDIECIKRASLDMRNVLGLAADASACLPRIWDARQSLQDLAE
jgi:hypothetical protein